MDKDRLFTYGDFLTVYKAISKVGTAALVGGPEGAKEQEERNRKEFTKEQLDLYESFKIDML